MLEHPEDLPVGMRRVMPEISLFMPGRESLELTCPSCRQGSHERWWHQEVSSRDDRSTSRRVEDSNLVVGDGLRARCPLAPHSSLGSNLLTMGGGRASLQCEGSSLLQRYLWSSVIGESADTPGRRSKRECGACQCNSCLLSDSTNAFRRSCMDACQICSCSCLLSRLPYEILPAALRRQGTEWVPSGPSANGASARWFRTSCSTFNQLFGVRPGPDDRSELKGYFVLCLTRNLLSS